jgi:alpha-tubulin suppressor-like RCC1 family protein
MKYLLCAVVFLNWITVQQASALATNPNLKRWDMQNDRRLFWGRYPNTRKDPQGLPWKSIQHGYGHTCALSNQYQVYCWGMNNYGVLGVSASKLDHTRKPRKIFFKDFSGRIVDLTIGNSFALALTDKGTVYSWGTSIYGVLGRQKEATLGNSSPNPQLVDFPDSLQGSVVGIVSGVEHSCVRSDQSEVYCWGSNSQHQLGITNLTDQLPYPTKINLGAGPSGVLMKLEVIKSFTTCAVTLLDYPQTAQKKYAQYCWGHGFGPTPKYLYDF